MNIDDEKGENQMYRIGMFSKLGLTTIKTLRYYDDEGLLVPAHVDEDNGYRYYNSSQLFDLNRIVSLRQMGFSIPEIKDILDGSNMSKILQQRENELKSQIDESKIQLRRLSNYILEQQEDHIMDYQTVIKNIPSYTVFSVRKVIPDYSALMHVMPEAGKKVSEANPGIKCVEPDYCFNIYHDGEYKEKNIDVEICQAVTSKGKDTDDIKFKEIPATKVASVLHKGAYENLGKAYAYIIKWVEDHGYKIVDHVRESYIDGIWNKDNEDDWLTEIQVPIEIL